MLITHLVCNIVKKFNNGDKAKANLWACVLIVAQFQVSTKTFAEEQRHCHVKPICSNGIELCKI